jgi:hypothetical protein
MAIGLLYIDLLASAADGKPAGSLEERMINFLEGDNSTESLDDGAFDQINGSETKADYLLGGRRMIAELKTLNASPLDRTEQRLKERFAAPDAPIVLGTVGVSQVIESLPDREAISKMMIDMAGRAVRRHLQKANEQIGAMKSRLKLPDARAKALTRSPGSEALSAALKQRGFKFVGPVIVYTWMRACGLVNDHETCCFRRTEP